MSSTQLELRDIYAGYKDNVVVKGLNLQLARGEFVSLLGPSGCGKSTTLRLIAGLEQPISGDILVDGKSVARLPAHKRSMGVVFQDYALFPHMTVRENVEYGLRMRAVPDDEVRKQVDEMIDMVGLSQLQGRYPKELSGGQRQRVAMARAMAIRPSVLLLDEPFAALDRHLRARMQSEVRQIQRNFDIPTIFVTHDQEEALAMSDRVAVMSGGVIIDCGAPRTIYEEPTSRFSLDFIGGFFTLPVTVQGRTESHAYTIKSSATGSQDVRVGRSLECEPAMGAEVLLALRAEQVRVREERLDGHVCVPVTVREKTFVGGSIHYVLESANQRLESVEPAHQALDEPPGAKVMACWPDGAGWLIHKH